MELCSLAGAVCKFVSASVNAINIKWINWTGCYIKKETSNECKFNSKMKNMCIDQRYNNNNNNIK